MRAVRLSALFAGVMLCAAGAFAADPAPVHLKGQITSVASSSFDMTSSTGDVQVEWNAKTRIASLEPAKLADITQGMFVSTAAIPEPDGSLKAVEVHIFPEELRGTGEGFRPFPQLPQGTMTNATVTDIVGTQGSVSDDDLTLTLKYKDGEKKVRVPKGTPIVLLGAGDASLLKPQAKVSVTGAKDGSGKLVATRILVGLDGVTPPM